MDPPNEGVTDATSWQAGRGRRKRCLSGQSFWLWWSCKQGLVVTVRSTTSLPAVRTPIPWCLGECCPFRVGWLDAFRSLRSYADPALVTPSCSFIRDAGCFPVLMMAARVFEGPLVYPHRLKEWLFFAALGFTGMFVGQVMYLLAIYYSSANIASIYQPAMPVWTVLFVLVVGVVSRPSFLHHGGWRGCPRVAPLRPSHTSLLPCRKNHRR